MLLQIVFLLRRRATDDHTPLVLDTLLVLLSGRVESLYCLSEESATGVDKRLSKKRPRVITLRRTLGTSGLSVRPQFM